MVPWFTCHWLMWLAMISWMILEFPRCSHFLDWITCQARGNGSDVTQSVRRWVICWSWWVYPTAPPQERGRLRTPRKAANGRQQTVSYRFIHELLEVDGSHIFCVVVTPASNRTHYCRFWFWRGNTTSTARSSVQSQGGHKNHNLRYITRHVLKTVVDKRKEEAMEEKGMFVLLL